MKLRNTSDRDCKIKFVRLDGKVAPADRDPSLPAVIVVSPGQVAEVPDIQWNVLRGQRPYKVWLEKGTLVEEGAGGTILPGDGDADCPFCLGRGFITIDSASGRRCKCVAKRDVIANVRRIWPDYDLMKAALLKKPSKLRELVESNAWITSTRETFRAHLKHVAVRQGPSWFARVRSDADMMSGWFASAKAKSIEIFDADVSETVARDMDIQDLAEPPDLLIMVLGVKRARNVATPEVLMEILETRCHVEKPTWIVDQPTYCVDHDAHRCNSPEVLGLLQDSFKRVLLDGPVTSYVQPEELPDGVEDIRENPAQPFKSKGPARIQRKMTGKTRNEDITVGEE